MLGLSSAVAILNFLFSHFRFTWGVENYVVSPAEEIGDYKISTYSAS